MPDWVNSILLGVMVMIPGIITAVVQLYRNKADASQLYAKLAIECAEREEKLRQDRNYYRDLYEQAQQELEQLKQKTK